MALSHRWVMRRGGSLPDGVLQDRISGEVGWQQKSYPLGGDGTHALVWVYSKDSNDTDGSDRGWVDYLQWTPGGGGGGSSTTDWEQITYTYDPSGRRIAKDVDGVVTKYLYDGDQCIAEYDANDVLLRKYIHGPCIDEPICMVEAAGGYAGTYYYHYDALGSVVALSDADGDTVQVYEYDVYGQVAASDPNHPNRFMFTGREFDKETGLYYYRARYYNPTIGRFLQTDPIGYGAGMNMYRYCMNNPVAFTDPSGLYRIYWGSGTTEPEKDYVLASMARVQARCAELLCEIDYLEGMLGEQMKVSEVYNTQLLDELANLKNVLTQVRNGIASKTEGLRVKFVEDLRGEDGQPVNGKMDPYGRFWTLMYSRETRCPAPNPIDMDVTTLHELSHKYGTKDEDGGNSWMNAYYLQQLDYMSIQSHILWRYFWSLMFKDPETGEGPQAPTF